MNTPELSLVIPCHNEEKNLEPLMSAIHAALDPLALNYEVVVTDDCSTDHSWSVLKELAASDPRLRIQRLKSNCGESAASWAGIRSSRGRHIATLDADLQNDPKDLPQMLEALKNADFVYVKNWSTYTDYGKIYCNDPEWMLTCDKLKYTNNAKVMHCLPVRRNVELSDEILDSSTSLVTEEASNRVWAAQAVLSEILNG